MRVVRETSIDGIRISLFDWNNKYLLKFDSGMAEQTFKVSATDVLDEKDFDQLFDGQFFEKVKERFDEMHQLLHIALKNF